MQLGEHEDALEIRVPRPKHLIPRMQTCAGLLGTGYSGLVVFLSRSRAAEPHSSECSVHPHDLH